MAMAMSILKANQINVNGGINGVMQGVIMAYLWRNGEIISAIQHQ
jgi:hypothetical protein